MPIVLVTHAAFDADPVFRKHCIEVVWHEIVAWAKTLAVRAAAETAMRAVGCVFHAAHLFIAERANEVVEVPVCESEEHGGGEHFKTLDDLQVQLLGKLHEGGYLALVRLWMCDLEVEKMAFCCQ